ncbi:hypothetical protein DPMN_186226 [Dreissena polymorpha]|uniref:Sodium-dependent multivitamin transporter n=1 Tax=Dreissena polymorpha TaxID=45954 RepID=A0A9D4I965_DREPO|nr:hypothetical protein DPMN_186226 [Dreissena polymorpha]
MSMDNYLRPADVAVLCGGILASLVVGVVYAVKESRRESSSFRYHRRGGKLHPVPVAVSLVVTFESSISYLGLPSVIYMYGSYYAMLIIGLIAGYVMMFFITIPLFYPLQITSTFRCATSPKEFDKCPCGWVTSEVFCMRESSLSPVVLLSACSLLHNLCTQ